MIQASGDRTRIADLAGVKARESEVFARFGGAASQAQLFERLFATVLAMRDALVDLGDDVAVSDVIDQWRRRTAGQMLHSLRKNFGELSPDVLDLWGRAVDERNRLMHRFFTEHEDDSISVEGMQRMVDDADEMFLLFREAWKWCADVRTTTLGNVERLVNEAKGDDQTPSA